MAIDLLCIGESLLELTQMPAGPEEGRVLYEQGQGGDALAVAVAAARQGARVGIVGVVGQDAAGEAILAFCKAEGIEATALRRAAEAPTGLALVTPGAAVSEVQAYRHGMAAPGLRTADLPEKLVSGCRLIFASGISQGLSETAADAVFQALATARRSGVAVAYDTRYRPALWPAARAAAVIHAALCQADVALPSLEDARLLTGLTEPEAILDFYLGLGPGLVVLKMGAEGFYVATPEDRQRVAVFPAAAAVAVDANGASEAFTGTLLARLLVGEPNADAVHYAAAAATIATTGYGAIGPIPRAPEVFAAMAMRNR